MPDTKSMILFVTCWLLLAVVSLPSGASAATGPEVSDTGGSSDTVPPFGNTVAAGQTGCVLDRSMAVTATR